MLLLAQKHESFHHGHIGVSHAPIELEDLGVGLGKRGLQTVEQVKLVDVLLLAQKHESFHHGHIGVSHGYFPSFTPLKSKTGFKVHFFTSS